MPGPLLHGISVSESQSWLTRVRENFRQLLTPSGLSPSSSNGAPIHVLKLDRVGKAGSAQTFSLLMHAGILLLLVSSVVQGPKIDVLSGSLIEKARERLIFAPNAQVAEHGTLERDGGGGEHSPVPATHGFLAPRSSVQLASPRLPDSANHPLPVAVTILDAQAPEIIKPVQEVGLPWMPNQTNSAGPGTDGGIGAGRNGGLGDAVGTDEGEGDGGNGPNGRGISVPTCVICPYPVYTNEARHVKVQGTVTLRVLVGSDGKASEIRVLRGVGYGLEERAVQTVRGWKFTPARDAAHRPVAAWVTVEAVFRLF
jgi:periplasmic protein TonB